MSESEWHNSCVKCGFVKVTHGAELPGTCPGCKDSRWLCHLTDSDNSHDTPTSNIKAVSEVVTSAKKRTGAEICIPDNSQDTPTGSDKFMKNGIGAKIHTKLLKNEALSSTSPRKRWWTALAGVLSPYMCPFLMILMVYHHHH